MTSFLIWKTWIQALAPYPPHVTLFYDRNQKLDVSPIWRNQYPHSPAAEAGIVDTIEGLLKAGVLEPCQFSNSSSRTACCQLM
ncbi:hypothetical protein GOODEAATRI_030758 [Goodea atripinnis]|uniref:Uncharacterized protein n=1 Tax=Goodea atripinnis TaxID=208336 RepID=A0ABV0PT10_9TELE